MSISVRMLGLQLVMMAFLSDAQAQKNVIDVGVHMGMAMSKLSRTAQENERAFYFSFVPTGGVSFSLGLNDHFSLVGELNYTQIRSEREGLLRIWPGSFADIPHDKDYYSYFTDNIRLDYLEIPLLLRGSIGDRLKAYLVGGVFIGFNLRSNYKSSGKALVYSDREGKYPLASNSGFTEEYILASDRNIAGDIRQVNLGGCEGIGIMYTIGRSKIQVEGRYSFGLTNVWRDQARNGVNRTDNLVLQLSYSLRL